MKNNPRITYGAFMLGGIGLLGIAMTIIFWRRGIVNTVVIPDQARDARGVYVSRLSLTRGGFLKLTPIPYHEGVESVVSAYFPSGKYKDFYLYIDTSDPQTIQLVGSTFVATLKENRNIESTKNIEGLPMYHSQTVVSLRGLLGQDVRTVFHIR